MALQYPACAVSCVAAGCAACNLLLTVHLQGDTVAARKGFENAARMRCNGRPSIAAQLALANLQFNQRNYADALRL